MVVVETGRAIRDTIRDTRAAHGFPGHAPTSARVALLAAAVLVHAWGCGAREVRRVGDACYAGDGSACWDAAALVGRPQDETFIDEACRNGRAWGCERLAYRREDAGKLEEATAYYRRACALRSIPACRRLGYLEWAQLIRPGAAPAEYVDWWTPASPDIEKVPTLPPLQDGEPRGQLDRSVIQETIRTARRQVRECYEHDLAALRFESRNAPEGRMMVSFVIRPDGNVGAASASEDDLGRPRVTECALRVVRSLRFMPPRGGGTVNVNYPFVFSSGGEPTP